MISKLLVTTAMLVALAVPAFSQTNPPPPPPGDAQHGFDGHDMMSLPPPDNAGIDIRLGRGAGLHVDCGKDDIKVCVDALMPVLDKVGLMLASAPADEPPGKPPPPPPPGKKP